MLDFLLCMFFVIIGCGFFFICMAAMVLFIIVWVTTAAEASAYKRFYDNDHTCNDPDGMV